MAVEARAARRAPALVHIHMGETSEAVAVLTGLASERPEDTAIRQLLAQALVAKGQPKEAVQELEEMRALSPDDPELAFTLASA